MYSADDKRMKEMWPDSGALIYNEVQIVRTDAYILIYFNLAPMIKSDEAGKMFLIELQLSL